jgi:hypothetical protein
MPRTNAEVPTTPKKGAKRVKTAAKGNSAKATTANMQQGLMIHRMIAAWLQKTHPD